MTATGSSHEIVHSKRPSTDDKMIFQPVERTGAKCRCSIDMENKEEDEDDEQELQAELFNPDVFYKHSKKLKLLKIMSLHIFQHSCLSNSVRRTMAADNLLLINIFALTAPLASGSSTHWYWITSFLTTWNDPSYPNQILNSNAYNPQ